LGVELIHLNYHDQLRSNEGFDGHVPHARSLIKELYDIVAEIKPDVIITWGPDGSSNHMDHRLVGASMTQIVVNKVWDNSISLYYYGIPSDHLDNAESKILRGQDKRYLTTRISYTDEDIEKAYNSRMCHKSQIRPTTLKAYKARKTKNGAAVYLRKFITPAKITYSIF
jgi:LmbE family N-acetylglucosaminyl deacetylase